MNLAFDIDGVFTDIEKFQLEHGKRFFKNHIVNEEGSTIKEIFGCNKLLEGMFWLRKIIEYATQIEVRENAAEIISKLKNEGNHIYIITSRALTTNKLLGILMRVLVEDWLKKNKIEYDKIIYCSVKNSTFEKKMACEKYKIDYIVEDNVNNIKAISQITNVLCMDAKYNKECNGNNIKRVSDFNEVYNQMSYNKTKKLTK